MPPIDSTWPLQTAKDQLSQLVRAAADQPQTVTVHGKPAAVVLSPQEYGRLKSLKSRRRQSLSADLLRPGLLADDDLAARRGDAPSDQHRDVKL